MTSNIFILLNLLLLSLDLVGAIRFPVEARQVRRSRRNVRRQDDKIVNVDTVDDIEYTANITMGGQQFEVTIDTGSSDLWIQRVVPNAQNTQFRSSVNYAVGAVQGPVQVATTTFSGFTVQNQAFIAVPPGSASDLTSVDGLIGLGPSSGSNIRADTGNSRLGDPFLDGVFIQDKTSPNLITVMLSRDGDTGKQVKGEFSIGEVSQDLSAVNNQPKLPIQALTAQLAGSQHWTSLVDGIIGPNGQPIQTISQVPGVKHGQMVAVYDSGFTFPQVPKQISDGIYSQVPSAQYDDADNTWIVPCKQEVNLTFIIGGQKYPIHPWDVAMDVNLTDNLDRPTGLCRGAFQPITSATDPTFDMILGMAFLRNAYMLINFGDFVDGNPENQGNPFMQLLSVTNPADAHNEFVQSRLNGVDSTGNQTRSGPTNPKDRNSNGDSDGVTNAKSFLARNWPYFAAAGGVLALLIIGLCIGTTVRSRRKTYVSAVPYPTSGPYRPLNDPAPAPAMELHQHPGGGYPNAGYAATYYNSGGYTDPYYRG